MSENAMALVVIRDNPKAAEFSNRLTSLACGAKDRIAELEKMKEHVLKSAYEQKNTIWREFEDHLKDSGILPRNFSHRKHDLYIENGVLFVTDKEVKETCDCIICRLFGKG